MFFKQLYLGCLAQASYVIGSNGEAAVVDPRRDVDEYLAVARENGLRIRYVVETHLHADFVSGHRELAERTGAEIVIGAEAGAQFPHRAVRGGDTLPLGDMQLRVLATPGHTPESICLVIEENGRPSKVLTGDTLFIGDVGRPDLAGGAGFTSEQMAAMLYESLHHELLRLPDDVEVWPAHGAGSLCGRSLSRETSSTIGVQRRVNYALQPMSEADFVAMMTTDMVEAPPYFALDAAINRRGAVPLKEARQPRALTPAETLRAVDAGAIVLDVRRVASFGEAHVPRAMHIGLEGQYASWAGTFVRPDWDVVLVTDDDDRVAEASMRLARVGLENASGFVKGGMAAWCDDGMPTATVPQVSVHEVRDMIETEPRLQFVDVRREGEYRGGRAAGSVNLPLHELPQRASELDRSRPTAVICGGGYRSSIGTSLLERAGFTELFNVTGGTSAWVAADLPFEK